MKTQVQTTYVCDYCGVVYGSVTDAARCENAARDAATSLRFMVGDIVVGRGGFRWFDGDARWISNPEVARDSPPKPGGVSIKDRNPKHGNCFDTCCTYSFFYVVTAIDDDPTPRVHHRPRYHVVTKAMTGREGYASGYTFDEGHMHLDRVENPPSFVVEDSKDLLGRKAAHLL